jgi:hypothetical protein
MTAPVRAALYLQVSTGRQADNDLSIPDQRRQAKRYCSRGWEIVADYERMNADERRRNAMGLLSSLNIVVMTAGDFDYTSADCMGLMQESGFCDMRFEVLSSEPSMVIGVK